MEETRWHDRARSMQQPAANVVNAACSYGWAGSLTLSSAACWRVTASPWWSLSSPGRVWHPPLRGSSERFAPTRPNHLSPSPTSPGVVAVTSSAETTCRKSVTKAPPSTPARPPTSLATHPTLMMMIDVWPLLNPERQKITPPIETWPSPGRRRQDRC